MPCCFIGRSICWQSMPGADYGSERTLDTSLTVPSSPAGLATSPPQPQRPQHQYTKYLLTAFSS